MSQARSRVQSSAFVAFAAMAANTGDTRHAAVVLLLLLLLLVVVVLVVE